jgi:hypothetical protein
MALSISTFGRTSHRISVLSTILYELRLFITERSNWMLVRRRHLRYGFADWPAQRFWRRWAASETANHEGKDQRNIWLLLIRTAAIGI